MLKKVISKFSKLTLANAVRDDDVVDQLHHYAMVATLAMLGIAVASKQFVGKPIHCWLPAEYKEDDQSDYVNSLCWVSQMYNVPFTEELPVSREERRADDKDISFYRWATVMFLLQAIMFELPHLFWRNLKGYSGVNIKKIVSMCIEVQTTGQKKQQEKLGHVAHFIERWLNTYRRYTAVPFSSLCVWNKRSGCYLTCLYSLTKLLYLTNVLAQFQLLTTFLGFNFWNYGSEVIKFLADDTHWEDLHHFPRIGICDFEIRQLQNLQIFTVQCVLSVNLFLEKIFAGQWFVLAALSGVTIISTIFWFVEVFTKRRERFLMNYFYTIQEERIKNKEPRPDGNLFKNFVRRHLRSDGVFLLRVIGNNTTEVMAYELLKRLWETFEKQYHKTDDDVQENIESADAVQDNVRNDVNAQNVVNRRVVKNGVLIRN